MDRILEQVQSGAFDPVEMFTGNKDKFLEVKTAIEGISNNLTKETCVEFLISKIMPTAFDKNVSDAVRDEALEIGFHLLRYVNLSNLSTKEQEKVFTLIEDTYSKSVGVLRDSNYTNWDRLWIFLIQFCHEKLHHKTSTANKLLRVLEVAFRNSTSSEQRLKAYDCWKHLIDNSSLNMGYMCTPKQIKLLMTPMKAKFSRMPVVLLKRCDTFVYLLEKLQDKAVLCLKEFLEFCFGPLEEKNDAEKMGQGKTVPEICIKGTKVLIEIIGHSHTNLETCMKSDDIQLNKQVINNGNFSQFAEILIKSVVECCILLDEWNKDSTNVNTIVKCLWRSILGLINTTTDETRMKCRNLINYSLRRLLERLDENKHFSVILANIIGPLINDNIIENLREIVFDIAMSLIQRIPLNACPFDSDEVPNFITSSFERDDGLKFSKVASTYFKSDTKCENLNVMCDIWLKCHITITPSNVSTLIWPIRHLQNFKELEVLNLKWLDLYKNECKTENAKACVIQEIEKLFQENPLLSSNVVSFLQLVSEAETRSSSNFVSKFLRLIEVVLTLPNLSEGNIKSLNAIISLYCDQKKFFYKSENNDEAIDKLCACLEHLITIHKDFSILSDLATYLKDTNQKNLAKFSKRLTPFLDTLMLKDDNSMASTTRKLIELLETKEKETESVPFAASRSLRMVNMANVTPKSSNQSLRLFGKSVEKSPLALRGSKPATTPKSRRSEDKKKIQLCDEKSSDYVPIETEVKVDFNNMNEHQKEVLKKRREDIPALYQDLTQSTSSMDIISNSNGTESKENIAKSEETQENELKRKREEEPEDDPKRMKLETSTQKIEEFTSNENEEKREETQAVETETSKDESVVVIESDKSATKASDSDTSKDESVAVIENDKSGTQEDVKAEEEIEDTKDKSIRKSARQAKRKLEEETKTSQKTNDGSFLQSSQDKKVAETPQRRSSRQVIRKQFITVREKKKPFEPRTEDVLRNECINDLLAQRIEEIKMKSDEKDVPKHIEESKMIEPEPEEEDLRNESIEDLLARVDRRIEEKRMKSEEPKDLPKHIEENKMKNDGKETKVAKSDSFKTLPDGNQNKIISLDTNQSPGNSSTDVYEFTGEDIPIEEMKKSRKAWKKNRTSFNRRDYIKKRKKTKKEKGHGYPFHVTADSSAHLPLSRSGTLRTIPSNQESETITIVITSSPPETDKKPQSVISEDVIESSQPHQESKKRSSTRKNSSPKKRSRASIENVVKRKTRSSPDSTPIKDVNLPDTLSLQTNEEESEPKTNGTTSPPIEIKSRRAGITRRLSLETNTLTQLTNKEESEPKSTGATSPPVEIRSIRAGIARRLSLETNAPSLQRNKEESEPETPDATSPPIKVASLRDGIARVLSLETNTFTPQTDKDESGTTPQPERSAVPIRLSLETNTSTRARRTRRTVSLGELDSMEPVSFLDELKKQNAPEETLPDTLTVNETKDDLPASPITCDTPDRTEEFLNSTLDISPIQAGEEVTSASTPKSLTNETSNVRVARLLQMVNPNVPVKLLGNRVSSPSTSRRVRKMRLKKEENLDILTFSREVPSPLTVPTSGILKRKFANLDDTTATPSPKRKRVNFPDPAITDKKIFIKDVEEYSPEIDASTKGSQDLSDLGENFVQKKTDRRVKLGKMFLDEMDKEEIIFAIKEFCNSQIQNDNSSFKNALKCLIQNLKLPEIAEIISDSILNFDRATIKDISTNLLDSGNCTNVVDKVVVPFLENSHVFDIFLPKLFSVLQRLPNDKLQCFTREFVKVFGEKEIVKEELSKQEIEEHVNKLDCDSMKDLIHKFILNLEDRKRTDFIVDIMNMASGKLPVNKEFVNMHVDLLQNFVKRMSD